MPFVNASIYKKAKQLAQSEGLSDSIFIDHNSYPEIKSEATYIPIDLLYDVYEAATENLRPGFSVRQGIQLNSGDYGTLGLSWRTCWKAIEILERIERFILLITDQGSVKIEESGGITNLMIVRDPHRVGLEIANEVSFVMITQVLNEVTGKKILPVLVTHKHGERSAREFQAYYQCEVEFNAPHYSIQFRTQDIDVHTIKADKSINRFLVERMQEEMQGIHANADKLLREVHQRIEEALPGGIPSLIQVSEYLGMSARTLKRRLADKGLTFREYVQKIQRDVSIDLIRNTSQSMAEIAFQTGFSEQSAFNRAFKRWTNQSPIEFRKSRN